MSGFGFTQLLGGGADNVVAGGTTFPTWDAVRESTSLDEGAYIVQGATLYRWSADDGVSGAGFPVLMDAYDAGTLTLQEEILGTEGSTPAGWTSASGGPSSYQGTYIEFDSSLSSDYRALTMQFDVTGGIYIAGYFQCLTMTAEIGVGVTVTADTGSGTIRMIPTSDDGAGAQIYGLSAQSGGIASTDEADTAFQYCELWIPSVSASSASMRLAHELQATGGEALSMTRAEIRVGNTSGSSQGICRVRNLRVYSVA